MKDFEASVRHLLNLGLPDDYADFMRRYGERLADDPLSEESWIPGLGSAGFAIGTTQAFRSSLRTFPPDGLVIGYQGLRRIEKINEDVRVYVMLNTRDGRIFQVDELGAVDSAPLAGAFGPWVEPALGRALLRSRYRSTLFAVAFDGEERAGEIRDRLLELQSEHLIDLEDAVVAVRRQDGRVRLEQGLRSSLKGAAGAGLTGFLIGSLFMTPILGAAFGAVAGAISGALSDTGIDDDFIRELARTLQPGSSALFVLVRRADPEKVKAEMEGIGGRILTTNVGKEKEAELQALMDVRNAEPR